jgi:hypothetical protein
VIVVNLIKTLYRKGWFPVLSHEQQISIFQSYPNLEVRKMSKCLITIEFTASKVAGKVIAHELAHTGNGYINGKYMSDTAGYKVHPDGFNH